MARQPSRLHDKRIGLLPPRRRCHQAQNCFVHLVELTSGARIECGYRTLECLEFSREILARRKRHAEALRTVAAMIAPCSVKASGKYFR